VDALLDEPATVLVMVSLAALLIVVEAALPTVGIAGTLALALGVGAVVGIARQDALWWPLLGPAAAVALWSVMVARRSRPLGVQVAAAGLFGAGGVAFGAAADSPGTVVLSVLAMGILAADFPWLHGAAQRLLERPTQVGMDSLVGATATVVAWHDGTGTVRLQGSLWNARTAAAAEPSSEQPTASFEPGDTVAVTAFRGTTLEVGPPTDHPSKEPTWKQ
jgi:membrane-bound ClpP family serine protease